MRITSLLFRLVLLTLCAGLVDAAHAQAPTAPAASAARPEGRILVARVKGSVTATHTGDRTQRPLADGDAISQHHQVVTGAGSSVILVFSNGATLNLGADTTLEIKTFLQDPFEGELAMASLTEEPTTSITELNLTRGELVGDVKHLRRERGSQFRIETPIGAAGIRGTTFRIVFRPDAAGKVFFTLSTAEGEVELLQGEAPAGIAVPTGQEVVLTVEVTVDAATGVVTVVTPPQVVATQEISGESQAAIAVAAQQIIEATAATTLSQTAAPAEKTDAEKAAEAKAAEEKAAAEQAAADKAAAAEKAAAEAALTNHQPAAVETPRVEPDPQGGT